jgi:hypothetical protein
MQPIRATLEDYKRIKTRASWQIVLEIDERLFPSVMAALGNPTTGESIEVGVVRLVPSTDSTETA